MKKIKDYYYFDDEKSADFFATCTPKGKPFLARFNSDSYLRKLIKCLSVFIKVFTGQLYDFLTNMNIDKTNTFLQEWENSVKIPLEIPRMTTIAERQVAIKQLVSKIPVYNINGTGSKYVETYIKNLTGIDVEITIETGNQSSFPLKFPIKFGYTSNILQFIWNVKVLGQGGNANNTFPLPFPVTFFDAALDATIQKKLDIVIKRVIPVYCDYYYSLGA